MARRFGNNKKYLSLKYTISYMKTYILASVIPSRISAKLYYLHIINTYVRHYKNSSTGGTLNCSPVHICCYRITIVWMSDIICILFTCLWGNSSSGRSWKCCSFFIRCCENEFVRSILPGSNLSFYLAIISRPGCTRRLLDTDGTVEEEEKQEFTIEALSQFTMSPGQ